MNILIAEDDDISRDLLRRILEREEGYTLTLTSDGEKAWAQLTDPAQRFDLGIFDLMMPRLSGLDLIARVRATPELKTLPVILCTAVKERATVERAGQLGVAHYIVKPYTRAFVLERIRSALRSVSDDRPAAETPKIVAARLGVDEPTLGALVAALTNKVKAWLALAQESRATADFQRDAQAAHALGGACLSLGLPVLHRELQAIETRLLTELGATERPSTPPSAEEVTEKLAPIAAELARLQGRLKPAA